MPAGTPGHLGLRKPMASVGLMWAAGTLLRKVGQAAVHSDCIGETLALLGL